MEEEEGGAGGGVRKRKRDGEAGDGGGGEELGEDGNVEEEEEYEGIAEESVEEVMRWLEKEIAPAPEGPPGFVTINGNEESCGPSFSAAASTVMASVDTRAGAPPVPWPWPPATEQPEEEAPDAAELELELIADGEWLAELLAPAPALEEQQQ